LRKITERRNNKPRLTIKLEPTELRCSRLSLGGKQKREQPAGWRHWLIRIVGIDARKCRDPASSPAARLINPWLMMISKVRTAAR
jgi:hypothetical protein